MLTPEQLCDRVLPLLRASGLQVDDRPREWLVAMAAICQEKIPTLNHIVPFTDFFFQPVTEYDEKGTRKFFKNPESGLWLETALTCMESAASWEHNVLKTSYERAATDKDIKIGALVNSTRLALTGKTVGPGLYELTELLGRDEAVTRIKRALAFVEFSGELST